MRIVFMGTPDFAAKSLSALTDGGFDVRAVFTMPDKPKNRGHKKAPSPVKALALERGIAVYEPLNLRDGTALELLREIDPDVIAVVAYGRILPLEILELPRLGCVNVHGSLLPRYRGAAPIQRAVLNGDETTGVTTMYMGEGLDTGDMIYRTETEIGEFETSGELFERLAPIGAELLARTLRDIEAGVAPREAQNEAEATYAPPLDKSESPINWERYPREIVKHIMGMQPWPVATATLGGTDFKIYAAQPVDAANGKVPGSVIKAGPKHGIEVACGGGGVIITELQVSGGRRMRARDYMLGHPIDADG